MFKKVLTIMLVFVGVLALAGCKPVDDPDPIDELTTLEKISAAMDQLELPGTASSNLVLLTSGLHDVVISWTSSNEDVIAVDGTVTIPLFSEGDKTVTVTAFLSLDGETLTKAFTVEVLAATEMTDAEKAHAAAIAFNGLISGNVIADVTLPLTGQYESTVSWSSSHPEYVSNEGVVVRPDEATGNVVVTLTGTVTVGTASEDVVLTVTVVSEEGATVYTSVANMYASALLDDYIEFTGIVTSVFDGGYFISDGTNSLGVYAGNNDLGAAIGDEVKVKGFYAVYNTLYQLSNLTSEEILSSGNANPADGTAEVKTVAEMLALDSSDPTIHGAYYTITGTVELQGTYNNVFLVVGGDQILIYYYSMEDSIAALEAQVGKEITITVFYYTNHGTNGPMLGYDGGVDGITVNSLPDADALAADIAALDSLVPGVTLESITLPAMGPNGTTFSGWTSSDTAVLGDDGAFVALGATSVTVTFTGTATIGALTETVTVDVLVPLLSTVAEVNAMPIGSYFQVSGTVYEISYYGFFIENNGAYLFIYGSDFVADVVAGDAITFLGSLGEYSGLLQASPIGELTIDSQGNPDVVTAIMGTVEGLEQDLYPRGARVTVTATISREGTYNNVFLNGAAGGHVGVYYRSNDEALFVDGDAGNTVVLTVVTYQDGSVLYQLEAADLAVGSFDDAATAQAVADGIDLGELGAVNVDLVLPGDSTDPAYTISWATSDAAVVDVDGTITMVSGSTPSATLTATVTVGVEVATRDFMVTLMDLNDNVPLSVTEALAMTDGDVVVVTGIITGGYYGERIIQDSTGAALWVDSNIEGDMGDEIIVVGTLATYTSNGNNNRQLDSATWIETTSTGNALVVDAETDVAAIFAAKDMMKRYTATLTIKVLDDGFGYVLFDTDASDINGFKFSKSLFAPWFEHVYSVDDTVELTFTVLQFSYDNVQMVNVVVPAMTDAQALAAAAADQEVPASTTVDLDPPTELYGVAITWASSDIAVIALDGTVTRPANGAGDATVTLTATFSIGTETPVDVAYVIVVPEESPPAATIFISEYYEGSSGNNKAIELYNPNDFALELTGYQILLYSNGAATTTNITDLTGVTIEANGVYVITNSGSDVQALIDASDATGTSTYFNGDDALEIRLDGVVVDVFGVVGEDPGSEWAILTNGTADNTLRRDPSIMTGNTSFTASEWLDIGSDVADGFGSHTVN